MAVPDQPLTYPTDRVVGIAADRETLSSVRDALAAADVDTDRIDVLCGEDAADEMDPDDTDGPVEGAVRAVQKALGEESQRLQLLTDAIDDGAYVVTVSIADRDDDELKRRVGRALHDGGATEVAFYGPWMIEEIQIGA